MGLLCCAGCVAVLGVVDVLWVVLFGGSLGVGFDMSCYLFCVGHVCFAVVFLVVSGAF